jgi:hypothetical protein
MSSVDSAGRGSRTDDSRRQVDESNKAEADEARKNAQAIRRLNDLHAEELSKIREDHNRQLEELKVRGREAVSERDMKYQKEIEDVRGVYQKTMQKQQADSESREKITRETAKSEIESRINSDEQRRQQMQGNFNRELAAKDQRFDEYATNSREQQQKSAAQSKRSIDNTYQKEIKTISEDRSQQVAQANRDYKNLRTAKDDQIQNLKSGNEREKNRLTSNFHETYQSQQEDHAARLEDANESLKSAIVENRERFDQALEKRDDMNRESRQKFEDNMENGSGSRVNNLKADKRRLEGELDRQKQSLEEKRAREVHTTRRELGRNIDLLQRDRDDIVQASAERTADMMKRTSEKNDKALNQSIEFFQRKIAVGNANNQERLELQRLQSQRELMLAKSKGESRVSNLAQTTNTENQRLRENYEENIQSQQELHSDRLREIRTKAQKDQSDIVNSLDRKMGDVETKYQEKIGNVQSKYEIQISALREKNTKEARRSGADTSRLTKEMQKRSDVELQAQGSQYEYKIEKLKDAHRKEVESLKERHTESLAQLSRTRVNNKN